MSEPKILHEWLPDGEVMSRRIIDDGDELVLDSGLVEHVIGVDGHDLVDEILRLAAALAEVEERAKRARVDVPNPARTRIILDYNGAPPLYVMEALDWAEVEGHSRAVRNSELAADERELADTEGGTDEQG